MHVSVHCPDGCGITAFLDSHRLVSTEGLVKLQRVPQRCPCTHGFPLLCMLPRHSPWPPFHAPWHEGGKPSEQCQNAGSTCCDDEALEDNCAECINPPWDGSIDEEHHGCVNDREVFAGSRDTHPMAENRELTSPRMEDASTQWQPQHVQCRFKGFRQPHAWVPPGLHVVSSSNQHRERFPIEQKAHAAQSQRKPCLPDAAVKQQLPNNIRWTDHGSTCRLGQTRCSCRKAADSFGNVNYTGTCKRQDHGACHMSAPACCSDSYRSPRQYGRIRLAKGWCCPSGVHDRPAAQPEGSMQYSEAAKAGKLERPRPEGEHVHLHEKQPQEPARSAEGGLACQAGDCDKHQASTHLSEADHGDGTKAGYGQMQQMLGGCEQKSASQGLEARYRSSVAQSSHVQLLADIDSFIHSLESSPQASTGTLQPTHAAAAREPVHATGAEGALPEPSEGPTAMPSMSGTDEGTMIASVDSSSCGNARESTPYALKATPGRCCGNHLPIPGQQHVKAAASESFSDDMESSTPARHSVQSCEQQEEYAALQQLGQHGTVGFIHAGRSVGFKHRGKTFVESDQAVHKLHDLEDVAQASLDELESLLREQQLKLAGMGLLPEGAARPGRRAHSKYVQLPRKSQRSALHAMADALSFATNSY